MMHEICGFFPGATGRLIRRRPEGTPVEQARPWSTLNEIPHIALAAFTGGG
jgi:hypothetical protein